MHSNKKENHDIRYRLDKILASLKELYKKMKIRINTGDNYYIVPIFMLLEIAKRKFDFELEDNRNIPEYTIEIDKKPVAYIAHRDGFGLGITDRKALKKNEYRLIFKFHYSPSRDYGVYQNRIIACGLYRWWPQYNLNPQQIIGIKRKIDIVARMRTQCSKPQHYHKSWMNAREILIQTAKELSREGYNAKTGMMERESYASELLYTKIAFIWTATSYLGWKIPEFLQQGVIMIHPVLGSEYPLREDITLDDGIHFVCCNSPADYKEVAKELLRDKQRMKSIRMNIVKLWAEKLSPMKMGEWYYRKLSEIKDQ